MWQSDRWDKRVLISTYFYENSWEKIPGVYYDRNSDYMTLGQGPDTRLC